MVVRSRITARASIRRGARSSIRSPSSEGTSPSSIRRRSAILNTDLVEHSLVVSPFRLHLDVQVEEHARLEVRLETEACSSPDLLDHLAALPDDDPLLRVPL